MKNDIVITFEVDCEFCISRHCNECKDGSNYKCKFSTLDQNINRVYEELNRFTFIMPIRRVETSGS